MIRTKSAREILIEGEIKNKLTECFKKCALGRIQLRKCVINALNTGLPKETVLNIINEISTKVELDEASLCAIVAIGQTIKHKEKSTKEKNLSRSDKEKLENQLRTCFKICGIARKQLRTCVIDALDAGLTKEEVLAISDDIVGGFGRNEVSVCAIIAVNQVLRYEENARAKPIDIVNERELQGEEN